MEDDQPTRLHDVFSRLLAAPRLYVVFFFTETATIRYSKLPEYLRIDIQWLSQIPGNFHGKTKQTFGCVLKYGYPKTMGFNTKVV